MTALKTTFSCFYLFGIALIILLNGCNNKNEKVNGVKEGLTIEAGLVLPEIRTVKNDTMQLALYPSAQFFFIDLKLKNSGHYINLIRQANKSDLPVRVKVYQDNRNEVAEIYPPSKEDLAKYQKSRQP